VANAVSLANPHSYRHTPTAHLYAYNAAYMSDPHQHTIEYANTNTFVRSNTYARWSCLFYTLARRQR
jgi:hypothetical protein